MPGAYTAKPEADATPPDVPDGWNPDWPYPGPDPPGYDVDDGEDYRLCLEAGNPGHFIPPSGGCYVVAQLMEGGGDFGSVNIASDSYITWSVFVNEEPRLISLDGSAYALEVSTLIGWLSGGWGTFGSQPLMTIDLTDDDTGQEAMIYAIATVRRDGASSGQFTQVIAEPISIPIGQPHPVSAEAYVVINSDSYPPTGYHYWMAYVIVTKAGDGTDSEGCVREVMNDVVTDSALPSTNEIEEITTIADGQRVDSSGVFDTDALWYNFYLRVSVSASMDASVTFHVKITWSDSTIEEFDHTTSDISSYASFGVKAYLDGFDTGSLLILH